MDKNNDKTNGKNFIKSVSVRVPLTNKKSFLKLLSVIIIILHQNNCSQLKKHQKKRAGTFTRPDILLFCLR